jgi:hypothetical protein
MLTGRNLEENWKLHLGGETHSVSVMELHLPPTRRRIGGPRQQYILDRFQKLRHSTRIIL